MAIGPTSIDTYARSLVAQDIKNTETIGHGDLCVNVIVALRQIANTRDERLDFTRWLIGRSWIQSTKDLTVAEARAILAFEKQLEDSYGLFQRLR